MPKLSKSILWLKKMVVDRIPLEVEVSTKKHEK